MMSTFYIHNTLYIPFTSKDDLGQGIYWTALEMVPTDLHQNEFQITLRHWNARKYLEYHTYGDDVHSKHLKNARLNCPAMIWNKKPKSCDSEADECHRGSPSTRRRCQLYLTGRRESAISSLFRRIRDETGEHERGLSDRGVYSLRVEWLGEGSDRSSAKWPPFV